MKEITVQELKLKKDNNEKFQLIDVREEYEVEVGTIGGTHIPMGEILNHLDELSKDIPVIIHCRSGARSAAVVNALEQQHGFTNLYNLKGGITAYANEIDANIKVG
ncbi:MAG: rhodanese-like domain-containing protein [Bacteroidota bacterium]|jgi:rhodanese-related sulfurtransferase